MCQIDWTVVAEFSKSMLTPTIAVITVYIAYQQLKTNRQKLRVDLYDRRLKIYEETRHFIKAAQNGDLTPDILFSFEKAIFDSNFLFEPDISEYLEEIYHHGKQLGYWGEQYKYCNSPIKPPEYNIDEILLHKRTESEWISAQRVISEKRFNKYLELDNSWITKIRHSVHRSYRRLSFFRKSTR